MASGKKVFNGCDASSKSILPQKNEQNHENKIVWPKIRLKWNKQMPLLLFVMNLVYVQLYIFDIEYWIVIRFSLICKNSSFYRFSLNYFLCPLGM